MMADEQRQPSLLDFAVGNARAGGRSSVEPLAGSPLEQRIIAMVPNMPPEIQARFRISSGFRDAARQAEVNPGVTNSRHMHRMAVDLANDPAVIDWISKNPQHGLGFPLHYMGPKEYNHMEMIDPNSGQRVAMDYSAIGDPGFSSGLRRPRPGTGNFGIADANLGPAPDVAPAALAAPAAPQPDPNAQLAAALALQGGSGSGDPFKPGGLSTTLTQGMQPAPVQPQTILQPQGYLGLSGPLPLSRRLG